MKIFYSDTYQVPLPHEHRFPMDKYEKLRTRLIEESIIDAEFIESDICDIDDLYLAHNKEYVDRVLDLSLERNAARPIGLPLSFEMVLRARASLFSFLSAAETSLTEGISSSLAGGTHHAHADRGEGFCFFNDFAVTVRKLHRKNPKLKILILDLDVHQGNGNSSILKHDKNVYIVSFHGQQNYPYRKIDSHIDIGFEKGTGDTPYLEELERQLKLMPNADLILYQAGVDALAEDKFGTLNLTHDGLRQRDQQVFEFVKKRNMKMAMALGGGYSVPIDLTVEAYVNTYRELKKCFF